MQRVKSTGMQWSTFGLFWPPPLQCGQIYSYEVDNCSKNIIPPLLSTWFMHCDHCSLQLASRKQRFQEFCWLFEQKWDRFISYKFIWLITNIRDLATTNMCSIAFLLPIFHGLLWSWVTPKKKRKTLFSVFFVLYIRKVYLNLSWWISYSCELALYYQ